MQVKQRLSQSPCLGLVVSLLFDKEAETTFLHYAPPSFWLFTSFSPSNTVFSLVLRKYSSFSPSFCHSCCQLVGDGPWPSLLEHQLMSLLSASTPAHLSAVCFKVLTHSYGSNCHLFKGDSLKVCLLPWFLPWTSVSRLQCTLQLPCLPITSPLCSPTTGHLLFSACSSSQLNHPVTVKVSTVLSTAH